MRKQLSFKSNIAKAKIEKILSLITTKQLTNKQISELIHVNHKHCKVYINHLLENKKIYISSWRKEKTETGFSLAPYYKKGGKENALKPKPIDEITKHRRFVEKRRKDKERYEAYLENRRLKYAKKKIQPKSDWSSSWIKPFQQNQRVNDGSSAQSN